MYSRARCICSTMGFEDPVWNASYYPENCPEAWRLAYFMNDFQAVYLPVAFWCENDAQIGVIAEEMDENFELIIEWPPLQSIEITELKLMKLAPLRKNISCIVLNVDGVPESVLDTNCRAIAEHYCINLSSTLLDVEALYARSKQYESGCIWYPGRSEPPIFAYSYQVVCLPCQGLRDIKTVLARLATLIEQGIRVGLFLDPAEEAANRAIETRVLIELMGLA